MYAGGVGAFSGVETRFFPKLPVSSCHGTVVITITKVAIMWWTVASVYGLV